MILVKDNNIELLPLYFTAHHCLQIPWGLSDVTMCLSAISLQCRSTESLLIALCVGNSCSHGLMPPSSSSPRMKHDLSWLSLHLISQSGNGLLWAGEMPRTEALMDIWWWMHWLPMSHTVSISSWRNRHKRTSTCTAPLGICERFPGAKKRPRRVLTWQEKMLGV